MNKKICPKCGGKLKSQSNTRVSYKKTKIYLLLCLVVVAPFIVMVVESAIFIVLIVFLTIFVGGNILRESLSEKKSNQCCSCGYIEEIM